MLGHWVAEETNDVKEYKANLNMHFCYTGGNDGFGIGSGFSDGSGFADGLGFSEWSGVDGRRKHGRWPDRFTTLATKELWPI